MLRLLTLVAFGGETELAGFLLKTTRIERRKLRIRRLDPETILYFQERSLHLARRFSIFAAHMCRQNCRYLDPRRGQQEEKGCLWTLLNLCQTFAWMQDVSKIFITIQGLGHEKYC